MGRLSAHAPEGMATDAVVLITGGTGSFGRTLARRLLDAGVNEVRIFSRDEAKQDQMRHEYRDDRLRFHLGDVRDAQSVAQAMVNVSYVFHAAALKQVPSCEFFPLQAVQTNVLGSNNVIEAAHAAGVQVVVCLSTDKAVYPINAMGMSKALMEKMALAFARNHPESETRVCLVRYGNVMYSRGSVIPLFIRQLAEQGEVTVTDPAMTRFMMTLAESVALVEHAFAYGQAGDLFVRKAPAASIETLVKALGELLGLPPRMSIIGIRHGEKIHETLASREELTRSAETTEYYRIALDARSLDYSLYIDEGVQEASATSDFDSASTRQLGVGELVRLLWSVPEIQTDITSLGRSMRLVASG